jgi:mutator protein MutT
MNNSNKPLLAVRAFITNSQDNILIFKRANTSYGNGFWNLPGGKIDFGETAVKAIIKEIFEETNLYCQSAKFLFYMDNLPSENTDLHFVTLFFECECYGDIELNVESSSYEWLNMDNIQNYQFAFGNDKAIKQFNELKKNHN